MEIFGIDLIALALKILLSGVDLLLTAIIPSIVVIVLAFLGLKVRDSIQKQLGWKWVSSTLVATSAVSWCVFLAAYFFPLITAMQEQGLGLLPSYLAPSAGAIAASFAYGLFKVTLTAIVTSVILLPLEFIGSYIYSEVSKKLGKKSSGFLKLAVSAYLTTLIGLAAMLFIVPQVATGLLYMLYFGFPM